MYIKKILLGLYIINYGFMFSVHAQIKCNLVAPKIDFGIVNISPQQDSINITNLVVHCINHLNVPQVVKYNISFNYHKGFRHCRNGDHVIFYELYRDSNRTEILGDGSNGTYTMGYSYMLPGKAAQTDYFPVYGKMLYKPEIPSNYFLDRLTIKLTY